MSDSSADIRTILGAIQEVLYNVFLFLRLPIKIIVFLALAGLGLFGIFTDQPLYFILAPLLALFAWKAVFPWIDSRNTPFGARSFSLEKNWAWGLIIVILVGVLMYGYLQTMTQAAPLPDPTATGDLQAAVFNVNATRLIAAKERDHVAVYPAVPGMAPQYEFVPGYTNSIVAVAHSPAGDLLAFVDKDGGRYTLRLWDIWKKRLLWARSDKRLQDIAALQIDLTNKFVLSVNRDGTVLLWKDANSQVRELEKAGGGSDAYIALNSLNTSFAIAQGKKLQLYSRYKDGKLVDPFFVKDYEDSAQELIAVAFGDYERTVKSGRNTKVETQPALYVLNADNRMVVLSADKLDRLDKWESPRTPQQGKLEAALILPERGVWVAVNGTPVIKEKGQRPPHSLDMFKFNGGPNPLKSFDPPAPDVVRELFAATWENLVTVTSNNQIQRWALGLDKPKSYTLLPFSALDSQAKVVMSNKMPAPQASSWNPASVQLAIVSNSDNKKINFYDWNLMPEFGIYPNKELTTLDGKGSPVTLTAFVTDETIATVDRGGYVRLWHRANDSKEGPKLVNEMLWQAAPITAIAAVSDHQVLVGNHDGTIRLWNPQDGTWVEAATTPSAVRVLAVDTLNNIFAAGYDNGEIQLRQLNAPGTLKMAQDQLKLLNHDGAITALAFAPLPNQWVLASLGLDSDETKRVQLSTLLLANELVTTTPSRLFPYKIAHPQFLAWSSEKLIVAGDTDEFYVWDTDQADDLAHDPVIKFAGSPEPLEALAVQNGAIMAFSQESGLGRMWTPGWVAEGAEPMGSPNPADLLAMGISKKWLLDRMASSGGSLYLYGFLFAGIFGFVLVFLPPIFKASAGVSLFMSELKGKDRDNAVKYARDIQLGRQKLTQYVEDSGVRVKESPDFKGIVGTMGGPGTLHVPEGYAAVIEWMGSVKRVVGKGTHILGRGEIATMRVHLFPRTLTVDASKLWTRDHFEVSVQLSITHEIDRGVLKLADGDAAKTADGKAAEDTAEGATKSSVGDAGKAADDKTAKVSAEVATNPDRFGYDEKIIRDKIWSPTRKQDSDWQDAIRTLAKNFVAELISRYAVEDLVGGAGGARRALATDVKDRLGEVMKKQGVVILNVRVLDLQIPDNVTELLRKKSHADIESRVKLQLAENQSALALRKNEADAVSLERMTKLKEEFRSKLIRQFADPLTSKDGPLADKEVAKQYLETMERIVSQMMRDDFTTIRFIETMEKLIDSPGEKHYYFPDMRDILGAGVAHPKDH